VQAAHEDLDRLGDRIVTLSAQIQVASYYLLLMIREFDERAGWGGGFRSCAHWLNWRTGLDLGAARQKVRVARALADLPLISEAMRHGQVSYTKVRALTRVATAENEAGLLEFAKAASAAHVERLVRSWRYVDRLEEAQLDRRRLTSRSLTTYTDSDGMLIIRGCLDPVNAAAFLRALEASTDSLYEKERALKDEVGTTTTHQQRRADALGLIAESALRADLDPGTRGDRYQVVVHVDAPVLQELGPDDAGHPGMAMLEDAIGVSAETSRRLACDCAIVTMAHAPDGSVLNVGRKTRTIPPGLRRALNFRDKTCRFPACGVRVCDGHHLKHWADGGETNLDNLMLLCRRHHVAIHEEGFRVEFQPRGEARFFHPLGWELHQAPAQPFITATAVTVLAEQVAGAGIEVHRTTGSATCLESRCDYGFAIDGLRRGGRRAPAPEATPRSDGGYEAADVSAETRHDVPAETRDYVPAETRDDGSAETRAEATTWGDMSTPLDASTFLDGPTRTADAFSYDREADREADCQGGDEDGGDGLWIATPLSGPARPTEFELWVAAAYGGREVDD
jgi:hypothetical protein